MVMKVVRELRQGRPGLRIVGGKRAHIADHPWQAALLVSAEPSNAAAQFCGGSVIAPKWIITGAHCVDKGTREADVAVLTGTDDLSVGGQRTEVDKIIIHQDWNPTTREHDVALLRLKTTVTDRTVALPSGDSDGLTRGVKVTMTGWGRVRQGGRPSKTLQQVTVPFEPNWTCPQPEGIGKPVMFCGCKDQSSYGQRIKADMFCAGELTGGLDTCQGDSGGPATVTSGSGRMLVGLTSWGDGCGNARKFGVYSRVSAHLKWIRQRLGEAAQSGAIAQPKAKGRVAVSGQPVVVDVHAHFFNLRYLPISGILVARGVPPMVANALDRILVGLTGLADFEVREESGPRSTYVEDQPEAGLRTQIVDAIVAPARSRDQGPVLSPEERRAFVDYTGLAQDRTARSPDDRTLLDRALEKARLDPDGGTNYFHFLATLMEDEKYLVEDFRHQYPEVRLAVAHQMDLEEAYAAKPYLSVKDQNQRLGRLEAYYPGEVIGFVAFDPFRGSDAMREVRAAIESGMAMGVKYYPPSGYRPHGNVKPPAEPPIWRGALRDQWRSRYAHNKPDAIDSVSHDLFAYCTSRGVPVLAHCTPHGFEAARGYGAMADPLYWRGVLAEFPQLRLCLAHAGGGDSWFSVKTWNGRDGFDQRAWDLATSYENVYLDFSFADEMLNEGQRENFRKRLKSLLRESQRPYRLGDKMMWGSDWNIVSSVKGASTILTTFESLFTDPELQPYARRFFATNALNYLNLASKLDDPRWSKDQRQYWRDLLVIAGLTPARPPA
jgi:secreted trypsin-like serine protease/predicted TIM-barrel fold metal-dependent hydrolase